MQRVPKERASSCLLSPPPKASAAKHVWVAVERQDEGHQRIPYRLRGRETHVGVPLKRAWTYAWTASACCLLKPALFPRQELPKVEKPDYARGYVDSVVLHQQSRRLRRGAGHWHFGLISSVWYLCEDHREDATKEACQKGTAGEFTGSIQACGKCAFSPEACSESAAAAASSTSSTTSAYCDAGTDSCSS